MASLLITFVVSQILTSTSLKVPINTLDKLKFMSLTWPTPFLWDVISEDVPGKTNIAYLRSSSFFVTDFTLRYIPMSWLQTVNLSSADNSSHFSGGQTILLGVPISTDVAIILHSLHAGGISDITPVSSNLCSVFHA